jgi:hypothetical protein
MQSMDGLIEEDLKGQIVGGIGKEESGHDFDGP